MSAQVAADLRAAADVLERDGWTQGTYHDDACGHCLQGAIAVAVGRGRKPNPDAWKPGTRRAKRFDRCQIALHSFLSDAAGWHTMTHLWNDYQGRTADEVIAALRAAADRAEATA